MRTRLLVSIVGGLVLLACTTPAAVAAPFDDTWMYTTEPPMRLPGEEGGTAASADRSSGELAVSAWGRSDLVSVSTNGTQARAEIIADRARSTARSRVEVRIAGARATLSRTDSRVGAVNGPEPQSWIRVGYNAGPGVCSECPDGASENSAHQWGAEIDLAGCSSPCDRTLSFVAEHPSDAPPTFHVWTSLVCVGSAGVLGGGASCDAGATVVSVTATPLP